MRNAFQHRNERDDAGGGCSLVTTTVQGSEDAGIASSQVTVKDQLKMRNYSDERQKSANWFARVAVIRLRRGGDHGPLQPAGKSPRSRMAGSRPAPAGSNPSGLVHSNRHYSLRASVE
jgi:hypothetical protein